LLSSWGEPGKQEPGEFHLPHSLWVDRAGFVYVCDRENSRIQVFTAAGKFVSQWRDIHKPTDIYFDAQEIAYVSEQLGHANPSTTLRFYAKWIPNKGRRWVDVLDRLTGGREACAARRPGARG
jgi:hypothetical protein